jgi:hypothetical protein
MSAKNNRRKPAGPKAKREPSVPKIDKRPDIQAPDDKEEHPHPASRTRASAIGLAADVEDIFEFIIRRKGYIAEIRLEVTGAVLRGEGGAEETARLSEEMFRRLPELQP